MRTYMYLCDLPFFFVKFTTMFRLFYSMQIPLISRPFCRKKEIKSQIRRKRLSQFIVKITFAHGKKLPRRSIQCKTICLAMTLHFKQFGTELWFAFTEVVCAKILFKVPSYLTRLLTSANKSLGWHIICNNCRVGDYTAICLTFTQQHKQSDLFFLKRNLVVFLNAF